MEKESDSRDQPEGNGDDSKQAFRPRRERKEVVVADEKPQNNVTLDETLQNDDSKPRRRRVAGGNEDSDKGAENGGWMNMSTSDSTKHVPKKIPDDNFGIIPQALNKDKHFQENDDDIMIIPDLDEDGADADQRIAHAPRNINRKIPTLQDLENEVKTAVTSADSGFDLGVLLNTLVPAALLVEADVTWTFESLLRDVTDELTATSKTVTETSIKPSSIITTNDKNKSAPTKSIAPPNQPQMHEQQGRTGK